MTEDKNATEEKPKKATKSSTKAKSTASKSKSTASKSKSTASKSTASKSKSTASKSRSRSKKTEEPKEEAVEAVEAADEKPKKSRSRSKKKEEPKEEAVEAAEEKPKKSRSRSKKKEEPKEAAEAVEAAEEKPKKSRSRSKKKEEPKEEAKADSKADAKKAEPKKEEKKPKKKSWRPKDRLKAGEQWLGELFAKMQLEGIEVEGKVGDNVLEYNVQGGDSHLLLGAGKASAKALESIQTILKETLVNGYDTNYEVHLDVDNFRQRRTESLEQVAKGLAEAAKRVGSSITVAGFNSFERRVVHQTLSESELVTTDSEGRGSFRKLRVDPR